MATNLQVTTIFKHTSSVEVKASHPWRLGFFHVPLQARQRTVLASPPRILFAAASTETSRCSPSEGPPVVVSGLLPSSSSSRARLFTNDTRRCLSKYGCRKPQARASSIVASRSSSPFLR
ncbi:hypothetical protein V8G54_007531 [Vigna mungo]|uniref:Uncharacterized protein n=1 Tax=Vigna mungo TaxID=3915 RepID=A0AAQ3S967_VIGMU